ncbi:helix-turn-helix domain-containing protein [Brevibacterium aurantiacum]|uniref:helix-turn-helix domain-containing protein n=1 Tax=Brevibacterium aurantiacum TaxID=273384 RepID=UPI0018674713|nr:helix-turn-helix transcriptional regulator [Brevibacterium aurantiacum]
MKRENQPENFEDKLAARIAELRDRNDLTYQQLADRMKAGGTQIHPSAIQKAEKAGRRVPVGELVAYARAFDMDLSELLGVSDKDQLTRVWQTYIGVERLGNVLHHARSEYDDAVSEVRESAKQSPELAAAIKDRRAKYFSTYRQKAIQQAANDGDDVSTPEKLEEFMRVWGYLSNPVLTAADDVLKGIDDGNEDQ